ncbi:universal stress protein [Pontibacter diazotrophicus]|uniref:Universal stress protein n=1 Tax=Pontibacter diazotrophicus TaxID=1400979 RepID=A0A3D8LCU8_9BACT|nr:universal stress protein [Pontibacter diazotrophicus]RDV14772.1 universal stress protein [Pontibacter diazotrophicus]
MENPNILMVGLDMTPMDDTLIRYTAYLCNNPNIESVYFIHVEKSLEIPDELRKGFPEAAPADVRIRKALEDKIMPYFAALPNVQISVLVEEGSPLKELLRWTKEKKANLVLVGRKLRLSGSGVLAQKLVRSGRTAVLFIPETSEPVLRRVVVSIDFSEYSIMALERVLHTTLLPPDIQVVCLHVYEVPSGYITLGESFEKFEERMRGFAQEKYNQLIQQFPALQKRGEFKMVRRDNEDNIGELIVMEAKRAHADMLVIGAKGKTAAALFILGSVTEKVLRYDTDIPLTIFRKPKEEMGFLDALLSNE